MTMASGTLENLANSAFVPTRAVDAERICRNLLSLPAAPFRVLDPTAGEGHLLLPFAAHPRAQIYGVELSAERARESRTRLPRALIVTSPFENVRITENAVDLIVSNPPYMIGAIGRLEYAIIRDATAVLRPGNPHVTIVPAHQWVSSIAPALTEGLKGNPRQVKRFLNALLLRKQLAMAAGLNIRDIVLVKLMLLEYIRPHRFDQLYEWQARSEGRPAELQHLEQGVRPAAGRKEPSGAAAPPISGEIDPAWQEKAVQDWLRLEPQLANTDLRDYFWNARDRLTTTISGLTMVPPLVRALYDQLVTGNEGELRLVAPQARDLVPEELAILLRLLGQQIQREPQEAGSFTALVALIEANTPGALERLLDSLWADLRLG